jgi:hypothetical protein
VPNPSSPLEPDNEAASVPAPHQEDAAAPAPAPEPEEEVRPSTITYRVARTCTDRHQRFREAGDIVTLPADEPVPKWFEPVGKTVAPETPKGNDPETFHEMGQQYLKDHRL